MIRPYTFLEGKTVVRRGASVGPFARLVDAEIGPDAQVLDHCLLRECVVGASATVGPFTHVRPGSRIGSRAKVGNFVELKKTHLGDGPSAAPVVHRDATVGPGVTSRRTITCTTTAPTASHPHEAGLHRHTSTWCPGHVGEGLRRGGQRDTEDVPPLLVPGARPQR